MEPHMQIVLFNDKFSKIIKHKLAHDVVCLARIVSVVTTQKAENELSRKM